MKAWIKRMKPKLKNWRWWLLLPFVTLALVFVYLPLMALESTSRAVHDACCWVNIGKRSTPEIIKKIFD